MPYYAGLKKITDAARRKRTVEGLRRLRPALAQALPARTATDTLMLATWNIREFDSGKYGFRDEEPYYYIAEILSHFDLIAIQEVRDGLYPLQTLKVLLGPWWEYLVTDVTLGSAGNSERMAFLFDPRKVTFTGLAAELVAQRVGADEAPVQLARSPYIGGFQRLGLPDAGDGAHLLRQHTPVDPRRLVEITDFAKTLAKHAGKLSSAPQYKAGGRRRVDNLLCSATSTSSTART